MKIEEIVKERILDNKKIFTDKELKIIDENFTIIKKIYLLGSIDTKIVRN